MVGSRSVGATVLWFSVLFLLAAMVTGAAFAVFVAGPDRGTTFYVCLSLVVAAEMVFFSHLLQSRLAQAQAAAATPATRIQVQGLIFVWFVLTVIAAVVAASPSRADTLAADRVLVIDFILTFLFFAVAYALYARDREVEPVSRQLQAARQQVQVSAEPVRDAIGLVQKLAREHPGEAGLADQVRKKLDMVCTQLDSALVSERAVQSGAPGEDQGLAHQMASLTDAITALGGAADEQVAAALQQVASQCDAVLDALRRRTRSLIS